MTNVIINQDEDDDHVEEYLSSLNEEQFKAVTHQVGGGLQVLAGPGSGKTHVLSKRVAYLVQHYKVEASNIVVLTFTNKASIEMKSRIKELISTKQVEKLKMGTFHSICRSYLQKYFKLIALPSNFIIADRDDCIAIIRRALNSTTIPDSLRKECDPKTMLDMISKAKSQNLSWHQWRIQAEQSHDDRFREKMLLMSTIFELYESAMKHNSALDFDDLLLYGLQLFTEHPRVVENVKNVLIDEFQDTNDIQYQIVKRIAAASGALTIVGDPDQGIYAWRNADVENLAKMMKDFHPCTQLFLENNYRSSGAVLGAALAVIRQDESRINKSLKPIHPTGTSVVLHRAKNSYEEALFVADQIKHVLAFHGGLMDFGDVAILLRYGALSRNIEVAFQKCGIPSRMLGGNKFFNRLEVKDMLSYLQLLENPSFLPAFSRCVGRIRSIGDRTVREIITYSANNGQTLFKTCIRLAEGATIVKLNDGQRKGMKEFVAMIMKLTGLAHNGMDVSDLIGEIVKGTKYEAFLQTSHVNDFKDRFENILELKAYAKHVADENPSGLAKLSNDVGEDGEDIIEEEEGEGDDSGFANLESIFDASNLANSTTMSPLRNFLSVSMLATDTETEDSKSDSTQRKVNISTVHSFKGLEAPIVFVIGVEAGIFPFYRSSAPDQIDEERRLLYVAITRAQVLCFLTHSLERMVGAQTTMKDVSPFISKAQFKFPSLFVDTLQLIDKKTRAEVAKVLGRPGIDEVVTRAVIAEHRRHILSAAALRKHAAEGNSWNGIQPNNPYRPSSQTATSNYVEPDQSIHQYRPLGTVEQDFDPADYSTQKSDAAAYTRGLIDTFKKKSIVPPNSGFSSALKVYKSTPVITSVPAPTPAPVPVPVSVAAKKSVIAEGQTTLSFAKVVTTTEPLPTKVMGRTLSAQEDNVASGTFMYQSATTTDSIFSQTASSEFARSVNSVLGLPSSLSYPSPSTSSSTSSTVTTAGVKRTKTSGVGSLNTMPETRSSLINEAVLLHPTIDANGVKPSLEAFQSKEREGLERLKMLGEPELVESSGEPVGRARSKRIAERGSGTGGTGLRKSRK